MADMQTGEAAPVVKRALQPPDGKSPGKSPGGKARRTVAAAAQLARAWAILAHECAD